MNVFPSTSRYIDIDCVVIAIVIVNSLTTSSGRFIDIVVSSIVIVDSPTVIVNSPTPSGSMFIDIVVIATITTVAVLIINHYNTSSGRYIDIAFVATVCWCFCLLWPNETTLENLIQLWMVLSTHLVIENQKMVSSSISTYNAIQLPHQFCRWNSNQYEPHNFVCDCLLCPES